MLADMHARHEAAEVRGLSSVTFGDGADCSVVVYALGSEPDEVGVRAKHVFITHCTNCCPTD